MEKSLSKYHNNSMVEISEKHSAIHGIIRTDVYLKKGYIYLFMYLSIYVIFQMFSPQKLMKFYHRNLLK